eukprot:TRINITY_DN5372_c0_g1_i1.p1 TRINITY_DN5372_c0_g1~~TRINITY_DN5372_c0_g1_i1.p1  ORF type:complete len:572 (+),score=78.36 TRINITY_DN5372_c0_g1_i1:123-1838(+)
MCIRDRSKLGGVPYYVAENKTRLSFQFSRQVNYNLVSNKDSLDFLFHQVFDQDSTQEEVFNVVAVPVVMSCLDGYNGTIFAYGQTGSGKTYTMSGADSWQMRGMIPRVLTLMFDQFEKRKNVEHKMYVSFMEIYNETAYDLLDRRHVNAPMESWSKVTPSEDDAGNLHLRNLTVHECHSEQDAIDLLMMGNFVRQVSATPMNQSSSRSHCIFTVTLEARHLDTGSVFISKLHMVDLAGSERISKSHVEGSLLAEAKHINLSLSFLEQVIIALNEKSMGTRSHIPYRNSLMTIILKDSLGGNCKTVMVATMSSDIDNLEESVSTARFAQRCAQLENEITRNEKVDLNILVKRLEGENASLQEEVEAYRRTYGPLDGKTSGRSWASKKSAILPMEELRCRVVDFLNEERQTIDVGTLEDAQECFRVMREIYNLRMQEYVEELTLISEKLKKYDSFINSTSRRKDSKSERTPPRLSPTISTTPLMALKRKDEQNSELVEERSRLSHKSEEFRSVFSVNGVVALGGSNGGSVAVYSSKEVKPTKSSSNSNLKSPATLQFNLYSTFKQSAHKLPKT